MATTFKYWFVEERYILRSRKTNREI